MRIEITKDTITPTLERLAKADYKKVLKDNAAEIYNRGQIPKEGTPFKTGELRMSMSAKEDEAGYNKDYAPHVEYGHRTRNGGFVPGQKYLYRNVEKQKPIFRDDVMDAIRRAAK